MHFGCVELVEQHGSTHSSRHHWRTQRGTRGGGLNPVESSKKLHCVFAKYTMQALFLFSLNP